MSSPSQLEKLVLCLEGPSPHLRLGLNQQGWTDHLRVRAEPREDATDSQRDCARLGGNTCRWLCARPNHSTGATPGSRCRGCIPHRGKRGPACLDDRERSPLGAVVAMLAKRPHQAHRRCVRDWSVRRELLSSWSPAGV